MALPPEALAQVLADLVDHFAVYDREWRYTYVNDGALKILGKSREDLLGRSIWDLFPDAIGNHYYRALLAAAADRRPRQVENYYAPFDQWFDNYIYPTDVGIAVFATDITARKRAERDQAESELRFRTMADTAPVFIWTSDRENRCDWFNRGWLEYTGRELPQEIGWGWRHGVHPDDLARVIESDNGSFEKRERFWVEYRLRRHDGEYRWMLDTGVPRLGEDGEFLGYIGTALDIHDRRLAEELRRAAEEQNRQNTKMEAIGRLAGGLAHDLNNQLQATMGFATFLERDSGLSPQGRVDLGEIIKAADRMRSLVAQLLAFSRQQMLSPETLDVNAAMLEAQALLQRLIGPTFEMQLDLDPAGKWVRIDRTQFLQVLMNLTINARDAQPDGGRVVFRTLGRILDADQADPVDGHRIPAGRYVELQVADAGCGISPDHLSHIFEPFFTTKPVGKGTGLGLATVHGIVTQSQGHIRVASREGEGTTFTLLLPSADAPGPELTQGSLAGPVPRLEECILLVEDEEMVRRVLVRTLRGAGFQVLEARDGGEALDRLAQDGPRIAAVLTDLIMPVMTGIELTRHMAQRGYRQPVGWMSGHPLDAIPEAQAGVATIPFIQKPVGPDQLVDLVTNLVGTARTHSVP